MAVCYLAKNSFQPNISNFGAQNNFDKRSLNSCCLKAGEHC